MVDGGTARTKDSARREKSRTWIMQQKLQLECFLNISSQLAVKAALNID
jgi:hypothetical protein